MYNNIIPKLFDCMPYYMNIGTFSEEACLLLILQCLILIGNNTIIIIVFFFINLTIFTFKN